MDLNTILIILGILALIGLVAHGIWANRREKSQYFDNANNFNRGNVPAQATATPDFPVKEEVQPVQSMPFQQPEVASQPSPMPVAESADQIKITLPKADHNTRSQATETYVYEPEIKKPSANIAERTLAEMAEYADSEEGIDMSNEQLRVELRESSQSMSSPISNAKLQQPVENEWSVQQEEPVQETVAKEFIMLYVVAAENSQFQGHTLAHCLDNFGFVFGKGDLYHRHVDTVASPVIFSVANINQPGTFNPYGMQDFTTVGIALFMQVPSLVGDERTNLRMMIQTAKNLAAELGGFVLTEQQELLDESAEQLYLSRV
ncbi:cell division protein ZipA [Pasteurellaceae bacterium 22721_9_1]